MFCHHDMTILCHVVSMVLRLNLNLSYLIVQSVSPSPKLKPYTHIYKIKTLTFFIWPGSCCSTRSKLLIRKVLQTSCLANYFVFLLIWLGRIVLGEWPPCIFILFLLFSFVAFEHISTTCCCGINLSNYVKIIMACYL